MTDTTKFLPGDRVRYVGNFHAKLPGKFGTVRKVREDGYLSRVDFGDDVSDWGCFPGSVERQPIEKGCYVRVTIEPDQPPTRIMDLFSTARGEDYAVLLHGGNVNVELLARVEEPATDAVYLPGDLILIINHRGNVVTVKECPDDRKPWNGDFVYWVDPDGFAWANSHVSNVKPAPIEKGAWVRVIDTDHKFQVFEAFGKQAWEKGRPAFVLSQLRAIEAPAVNDDLKQAQQLASTLAERHFPGTFSVGADLATVLNQIDNMTSVMTRENGGDTQALAKFLLMSGIKWDRQDGDDTCKVAQRIITQQREAIDEAAKLFRNTPVATPYDPSNIQAWLEKHAPLPKPEFKRGDLVLWQRKDAVRVKGRIVSPFFNDDTGAEIMSDVGAFFTAPLAELRHL